MAMPTLKMSIKRGSMMRSTNILSHFGCLVPIQTCVGTHKKHRYFNITYFGVYMFMWRDTYSYGNIKIIIIYYYLIKIQSLICIINTHFVRYYFTF